MNKVGNEHFETDQVSLMAEATRQSFERALSDPKIDGSRLDKALVGRIVVALAKEEPASLNRLVSLTLDALRYGDPRDW